MVGHLVRRDDIIVEVRNLDLSIVGQIHPDDLDVQVTDVLSGVGTWRVRLPAEHPMSPHLRTPGAGIVVTVAATGDVLFSGPVVKPEAAATADDPAGTLSVEGVSDDIHMTDRLAAPDPTSPDLDEQALAHDVRTGAAETLMCAYVSANAGPSAPSTRRVDSLTVSASLGRGPVLTKRARFHVLGALLNEIAAGTSLHWQVRQVGSGLRFEVEEGRDLTGDIRLDIRNSTLAAHRVAIGPPGATRVLVAGQGDLVDRQLVEMTTEDAQAGEALWGRRIERFVDQRQTDDPADLERAGKEVLDDEGFATIAVQIVPMEDSEGDDPGAMRFWWDWRISDRITVVVEGQEMTAIVTGYVLRINEAGARVGAVLGDPAGLSPDLALARRVDGIALRVDNLERAGGILAPLAVRFQSIGSLAPGTSVLVVTLPEGRSMGAEDYVVNGVVTEMTNGNFGTAVIRLESAVAIDATTFRIQVTSDWSTPLPAHLSYVLTPVQG